MMEYLVLAAFTFLFVKHFVADFLLQNAYPYMWQNKGTYGHPGGIIHAASHLVFTAPIYFILPMSMQTLLIILIFEFIAHYHIDWAKMRIGEIKKWKCNTHAEFWDLMGLDQLLHYLTYSIMIGFILINS